MNVFNPTTVFSGRVVDGLWHEPTDAVFPPDTLPHLLSASPAPPAFGGGAGAVVQKKDGAVVPRVLDHRFTTEWKSALRYSAMSAGGTAASVGSIALCRSHIIQNTLGDVATPALVAIAALGVGAGVLAAIAFNSKNTGHNGGAGIVGVFGAIAAVTCFFPLAGVVLLGVGGAKEALPRIVRSTIGTFNQIFNPSPMLWAKLTPKQQTAVFKNMGKLSAGDADYTNVCHALKIMIATGADAATRQRARKAVLTLPYSDATKAFLLDLALTLPYDPHCDVSRNSDAFETTQAIFDIIPVLFFRTKTGTDADKAIRERLFARLDDIDPNKTNGSTAVKRLFQDTQEAIRQILKDEE